MHYNAGLQSNAKDGLDLSRSVLYLVLHMFISLCTVVTDSVGLV